MTFSVYILGANSAVPTASRLPTAQLVNVHESYYLLDCGEGCQIQLRRNKIKFQRIQCIFISHAHGDHIFGLPGLVTTMELLGRKADLHLFAHQAVIDWLMQSLKASQSYLSFKLHLHPIAKDAAGVIYEDKHIKVHTLPLKHRIACLAYMIEEQRPKPKLNKEMLKAYDVPLEHIRFMLSGKRILELPNGVEIDFSPFILSEAKSKRYAFVTDTLPLDSVAKWVQGVDLLYHEATFKQELLPRAKQTFHTTARQAAEIAHQAGVKQLLIGHYSARYHDVDSLLEEAKEIFPNTLAAKENNRYFI